MLRGVLKRSLSFGQVSVRAPIGTFIRHQSSTPEPESTPEEKEKISVKLEEPDQEEESERLKNFRRRMKEDMAKLEMDAAKRSPNPDDPYAPWPDNVNPHTGEVGGPTGPEPTRYGDWERKGICVDF